VFDRYGYLFVTTGDRGTMSEEAQNPKSHIGKVLRITRQGTAAPGNPMLPDWAAEVWSLGHRNIQGAALHPQTQELWTAEHGARGGDELNLPQAGKNYGWPKITYGRDYSGAKIGEGTSASGLEQPVHYWDPSIAPSGMIFVTGNRYPSWTGDLLVGALAGEHIARLRLDKGKIVKEERLFEAFARFRSLAQAPDGWIYALTDNARPYGGLYRIVHSGS
jgi:glucose/arabinose dehydrogenase